MARRRSVPSLVNCDSEDDSEKETMDVDDDDNSDDTASDSSRETDLTDPADFGEDRPADDGEDCQNDAEDLAGLLADDEHPPEYYMEIMNNLDESLLQYDEYAPNSLKLLDRIEQEWFK